MISHLYPTSTPALNLNFKSSRVVDPRISCVRASAATYVDPVSGLVKTVQDNVARVDKDGLMVEEERTNVIQYSEDYNATGWAKFSVSSTANSGTAPDGTNTASLVQSTANAQTYLRYQANTSGTATLSAYLKGGTTNFARLYLNGALAKVDLGLGTIGDGASGNGTFVDTSIEYVGNGWYRCTLTGDSTGNNDKRIFVSNPDGTFNGVVGANILVWGVQCEEGTFPTSYIPTSGSTYQRKADEITLTNSGIFNPNENTIVNEDFGVAGGSDTLTVVGDGSKAEHTFVYSSNLSQAEINAVAGKDDDWWEWRVLGSVFGLNAMVTDGVVEVDWGDGSPIEDTFNGISHTFTNGSGYHTIKFRMVSGTYFAPKVGNKVDYRDAFISTGPAPENININFATFAKDCTNFKTLDPTIKVEPSSFLEAFRNTDLLSFPFIDTAGVTSFSKAWQGNSKLTSFPLIDTSSGTNFGNAWQNCTSLKTFPLLDLSSGTSFASAFQNCESLTSFPQLDFSSATLLQAAWRYCDGLTSFPLLDFSTVTDVDYAWDGCNNLTSFPAIDMPSVTTMSHAWRSCSSLTSFPLIDVSACTIFKQSWQNCSVLVDFPANFFDTIGTPVVNCFDRTWDNCFNLSATSVENILNSIDTSGQSAPAGTGTQINIDIDYNASSGTPNISTAVTNLKNRNWTITLNGVLQ